MTRNTALFAATVLALSALPAQAGEITRPLATAPFEWKPTECVRPAQPPVVTRGTSSGQLQMQNYAAKVARYIDCLKQESQRDFDRAQIEMQDAVQRELQAEVDRLNDNVERMVRQQRQR